MAAVDSFQLLYREVSRSCGSCVEALALIGALYVGGKAAVLLRDCGSFLRVHFLPRMIPNKRLDKRYGEWAVIYGATEPVARAYGEELAKQGISVILVCQDAASIRDMAASFSQNHRVETAVVSADLSLDCAATSKPLQEALRGRDVGFLVNCVDEALSFPQNLVEIPEEVLLDLLSRNVAAASLMTRLVLPGMVQRGRGAVINISSGACCRPLSGRATLSACTGFMDQLSRALHLEYGNRGIFVQSLIPFQIASSGRHPSSSLASEGWFVPRPEVYARHAISTLGVSHRTTGYWPHTLQYGFMRLIPEWIWVLGSHMLIPSR